MARPTEELLARIQNLVSDPRYLNKKHPQHLHLFAEATRAFEDAYPEPAPESDTTEGNVHVRAYTRIVDGKEVQVSAYDRTQQIAFHPPSLGGPRVPEYVQEIAEGLLHKRAKAEIVEKLRAHGDIVETEVELVSINGVPVRVDILGKSPEGNMYVIEVKTTAYDLFGPNQLIVYPMLHLGNHVFSTSPKIRKFGYAPFQILPPMCLYGKLAGSPKLKFRKPVVLSPDPGCFPSSDGGQ